MVTKFIIWQVCGVQPVARRVHPVAGGARPAHQLHVASGRAASARAAAAIALARRAPLSEAAGLAAMCAPVLHICTLFIIQQSTNSYSPLKRPLNREIV